MAQWNYFGRTGCLLGLLASSISSIAGTAQADRRTAPGRVLVQYRPGGAGLATRAFLSRVRARPLRVLRGRVQVLQTPAGTSPAAVAAVLARQPDVAFAEVDTLLPPAAVPNDPYYGSQWHLPRIACPAAWDASTGSGEVAIAIIDTGVDPNHPDLRDKLLPGWNFYDDNAETADPHGHGTAVAGTAAGATNNGTGTAGVAWNCKIVPLRVADAAGYAYLSTMAEALTWAADHGIQVANISYRASESPTVSTAAQYFKSRGGVVTIAAGNENQFVSGTDNPYCLTVGATDTADNKASFSNTGMNVDLTAPGVAIYTTNRGGGYGYWGGTSFSAPIVAGVAALLRSADPSLTPGQVFEILKQSADDRGDAGWDSTFGAGRVNAGRALQLALGSGGDSIPPTIGITSPPPNAWVSGTVPVTVEAADDVAVTRVELYVDGKRVSTATAAPFTTTWNAKKSSRGAHTLRSTAYDAAGNSATSAPVTVYR